MHEVKYNPDKYGLPSGTDKEGRTIVARGAWGEWLKSVNMNDSYARKFETIYVEISSNRSTLNNKGMTALYEIATMPEEAREIPHIIPSTGETKTVRELREVKKALKEAEQSALQAETARRQAEQDPIKKAHIAQFLKEYWGIKNNGDRSDRQNGGRTMADVTLRKMRKVLKLVRDKMPRLKQQQILLKLSEKQVSDKMSNTVAFPKMGNPSESPK